MMKRNKCIFFWRQGIDDILDGDKEVSGIPLQMSLWARIFQKQGWKVYCKTDRSNSYENHGMHFLKINNPAIVRTLHICYIWDAFNVIYFLLRIKPKVFIKRGPDREIFSHSLICKILRVKFVFFGASDVNFDLGNDVKNQRERSIPFYRKAIEMIPYIITQNKYQFDTLLGNYNKNSLMIPNIWLDESGHNIEKKYDVIWVSNFRPLKRAEWFVEVARKLPGYSFVMIGGAVDKEYYKQIKQLAAEVPNLSFLGSRPFLEVNTLIAESRLLICTSEYEGFPNTFIQAWAANVPVISTVNLNGIIETNKLGLVIESKEDIMSVVRHLLSDKNEIIKMQGYIKQYFSSNHDAIVSYKKLLDYIGE